VSLLTWLVMPRVSQFLNFWLTAPTRDRKNEALGLSAVAVGLVLFVVIFRAL
jgi:antibiotic biosynthesis monooxygenase (ABM) superfamily enzyme